MPLDICRPRNLGVDLAGRVLSLFLEWYLITGLACLKTTRALSGPVTLWDLLLDCSGSLSGGRPAWYRSSLSCFSSSFRSVSLFWLVTSGASAMLKPVV